MPPAHYCTEQTEMKADKGIFSSFEQLNNNVCQRNKMLYTSNKNKSYSSYFKKKNPLFDWQLVKLRANTLFSSHLDQFCVNYLIGYNGSPLAKYLLSLALFVCNKGLNCTYSGTDNKMN